MRILNRFENQQFDIGPRGLLLRLMRADFEVGVLLSLSDLLVETIEFSILFFVLFLEF